MKKPFIKNILFLIIPIITLIIVFSVCPEITASGNEDPFEITGSAERDELFSAADDTDAFHSADEQDDAEDLFLLNTSDETESGSVDSANAADAETAKIPLASLSLGRSSFPYTGSAIKYEEDALTVTATVNGKKTVLKRWTDYGISYQNNKEIGTASVTVKGRGQYKGSLTKTFRILPKAPELLSVSAQTRRIVVRWNALPSYADGMQLQYSTKSDFSENRRTFTITDTTKKSKAVTQLSVGKTYYIRLRSFKTVGDKRYYSVFGKVLSATLVKNSISVEKTADGKRTIWLDNAPESSSTVRFAVWSGRFGRDDVVWYDAKQQSAGRWTAQFSVANHRNDGYFNVHAYTGSKLLVKSSFKTKAKETATKYTRLTESLKLSDEADQLILVGAEGTSCTLTMLNRNTDGTWHQLLTTPGNVGLNGIGEVTEWNRRTPVGVYGFSEAFGICSDPGTRMNYIQVDSSYYWVDDVDSPYYNQFVTTKTTPINWNSAEHIIDYRIAYQYCLALDFNKECVPGAGSAIFLHVGTGDPTLGCIAVPLDQMEKIMQYVFPSCRIVIDTPEGLAQY